MNKTDLLRKLEQLHNLADPLKNNKEFERKNALNKIQQLKTQYNYFLKETPVSKPIKQKIKKAKPIVTKKQFFDKYGIKYNLQKRSELIEFIEIFYGKNIKTFLIYNIIEKTLYTAYVKENTNQPKHIKIVFNEIFNLWFINYQDEYNIFNDKKGIILRKDILDTIELICETKCFY